MFDHLNPAKADVLRSVAHLTLSLRNRVKEPKLVPNLLEAVVNEYDTLTRFYHGVEHLEYGFGELERLEKFLVDPTMAKLIWLNHDRFYAAGCPVNEHWSAEMAVKDAKRYGLGPQDIAVLRAGINATRDHTVPRNYPGHADDLRILLDIDLSSLALPTTEFAENMVDIRAEFGGMISEADLTIGQAGFAQGMLKRSKIFMSTHFAHMEAAARQNLNRLATAA